MAHKWNIFAILLCALAVNGQTSAKTSGPRNLIFMISDGFGVASEALARSYTQQTTGYPSNWGSALDSILVGLTRTRSNDTLVTDSAAGATAFSCAQKSFNGGIGISADGRPCGTVLEAAKRKGYVTGLVTTARISHATPAAFAAHAADRNMEDLIAQQMVGIGLNSSANGRGSVDLMFGGGQCYFLPKSNKAGCRSDDVDLWQTAQSQGFTTLNNRQQFDSLAFDAPLPVLALFAPSHMAYEIDRNPAEQPSLSEMTAKALSLLRSASANVPADHPGFMVMIEGARIDMAGHDNDPATHLHDILEYWKTINVVRNFISLNPSTLLVSTSDHETGGLTLGIEPEYAWYPSVLKPVQRSAEVICKELHRMTSRAQLDRHIAGVVMPQYLGITDGSAAEVSTVSEAIQSGFKACKRAVGHVVSARARIGWTTSGHTGADVGLYAYGNGSEAMRGSMDNTQVGGFLASYLGVDLDSATKELTNLSTFQKDFEKKRRHKHEHP
ncbi:alkaline-phosphatase-like protein [Kickxella alabastrina]|uniref:alkaline-phosphatase-like protein n=1 Tax=Kickxella alabastrina TaxID=61397 RepID=UPI00221FAE1E|nr:alkaline-phosphatase-like protein [Kickxella alabastrina]KAI7821609.1 alkaline-phosphatase-like protein [Kickxella alabastrina]